MYGIWSTYTLVLSTLRSSSFFKISPFARWKQRNAAAPLNAQAVKAPLEDLESFVLSFSSRTLEASKLCPFVKFLPTKTIGEQMILAARLLVNVDIDPAASQFDVSEIIKAQAARNNISLLTPETSFQDVLPDEADTSYDPDVKWVFFTSFADWLSLDGSFHKGAFYMRALGNRFEVDTRADPLKQFSLVAQRLKVLYLHSSPCSVAPPDFLLGPLIAKWAVNLLWPDVLLLPASSVISAFEEIERASNYSALKDAQRSATLLPVLPRARRQLKSLFAFLGSHYSVSHILAFGPFMRLIGLSGKDPTWEDFVSLNEQLTGDLLELVEDVPDVPGAVINKLSILLSDHKAEKSSKSAGSGPGLGAILDGSALITNSIPADQAPALSALRRSSALKEVMQELMDELREPEPDRLTILRIGGRCRISSVYKLIFGLLLNLDFGDMYTPVMSLLSGLRVSKLKVSKCRCISRYLWKAVFGHLFAEYPQMEDERFSDAFSFAWISGNWAGIDFEQRLVLDANTARLGPISNRDHNRPKAAWYNDDNLLRELEGPFVRLNRAIGIKAKRDSPFSFSSALQIVLKGSQYARDHPDSASSIKAKATSAFYTALQDSCAQYNDYINDPSPCAPFMKYHIPTDSRYAHALQRSIKASDEVMKMAANCDEFREILSANAKQRASPALKQPSSKKTKKKAGTAAKKPKTPAPANKAPTPTGGRTRTLEPGSRVKDLNVSVNYQEGWVEIANLRWDISKLKAYLKGNRCWPCAVTRQSQPDTVCLTPNKAGHIHGGDDSLHKISSRERQHILSNSDLFKVPYSGQRNLRQPKQEQHPAGKGRGKGRGKGKGGGSPPAKAVPIICAHCGESEHDADSFCVGNVQP